MTDVTIETPTVRRAPAPPRRALARPAPGRLIAADAFGATLALFVLVTGLWIHHGGAAGLTAGWSDAWTALAQITGLWASAVGLVGLVLVARPRALEQRYGLDRLFIWHRYLGETMALLVGAHVATSLVAASSGPGGFTGAVLDYTGRLPYMAGATVGALLVGVVTVTSLRSLRRTLAYETWYFVHLTAYVGLALAFAHTVVMGTDLATDTLARAVWIALHLAVLVGLLWGRWGKLVKASLHPLRVTAVTQVSPDTATVELSGGDLPQRAGEAGQFCFLRPLTPRLWWQAHPFSLSAAPTTDRLRFTVKDRGDASGALLRLRPGSRVVVEGPYGACTPESIEGRKMLFVAGGVGVAPVRAMLERLPAGSQPVVLYRARTADELVHLDELQALAAARGGIVRTLVGRTATLAVRDPFGASVLEALVPDVADRAAVLCGPEALLHAARRGLVAAGMPSSRIHFERPWW